MERDGTGLHCDSSDLLILPAVQISELVDQQQQGKVVVRFGTVDIKMCSVYCCCEAYVPSQPVELR